ncbi:hypothetical protein [Stackebrandtia nassauensis]|uniref:Uncharacterized protein n=1 Tax=Stackebrandtia nassauensis (strain DSM 44728 / CIP 108903 / NRRL B-16338 / NBRC 102104 / LLR-40K-21) TaxID=446470 RepID=D3PY76_STANL|nr:hypothetical protein [Stackebrandtia nassauensis]ADD41443.1 hypothetical protein Snas_1745 [Stackebrandtia nassauensis DSM 44728]
MRVLDLYTGEERFRAGARVPLGQEVSGNGVQAAETVPRAGEKRYLFEGSDVDDRWLNDHALSLLDEDLLLDVYAYAAAGDDGEETKCP